MSGAAPPPKMRLSVFAIAVVPAVVMSLVLVKLGLCASRIHQQEDVS